MMPSYKLTYFNAKARGELSRMIFAEDGRKYEDVRISSDDWKSLKPNTPFGGLPLLEVDGQIFSQSTTIARHLARTCNLAGKGPLEQMKADMVVDGVVDMRNALAKMFGGTEVEKATLKKKCEEEQIPAFLSNLEKLVEPSGYFVKSGLTWADIAFYQYFEWEPKFGISTNLQKYPKLKKLYGAVESRPRIAEWVKNRPVTDL